MDLHGFGRSWTGLNECVRIWPDLTRYERICVNLDESVRIWTDLDGLELIVTDLHEVVWTCQDIIGFAWITWIWNAFEGFELEWFRIDVNGCVRI